jgi:nucleoside-diphosphate-sugar epimerase
MVSPKGSVLLTGANGFVASHIVAGLIALEYHIVGTVRSEKKAQNVIALHPDWKQHITWAYISDIGLPSAFDEVFKNMGPFDYVIHNAYPYADSMLMQPTERRPCSKQRNDSVVNVSSALC